jgi:hypothetical protein
MNNKSCLLLALLHILFICIMPVAYSAELRPLNLPSAQRQYTAPAQHYAPAITLQAEPTVYDRFRKQAEGLSAVQIDEYRTTYQSSLFEATSRGDKAAEAYYVELLNILNAQ